MKTIYLYLLLSPIFYVSCFSTGKIIEAESLEKDENFVQIKFESAFFPDGDRADLFRSFDLLYARGINDTYDLGFFMGTTGFIGMYNKYELIDRPKNDLSIGLDTKVSVNFAEFQILTPILYYTHTTKKNRQVIINPHINYWNLVSSKDFYTSPYITFGWKSKDSPWTLGYSMGFNAYDNRALSHTLSIGYNFKPTNFKKPNLKLR